MQSLIKDYPSVSVEQSQQQSNYAQIYARWGIKDHRRFDIYFPPDVLLTLFYTLFQLFKKVKITSISQFLKGRWGRL